MEAEADLERLRKELQTGVTFSLKYLGYVQLLESLRQLSGTHERENLTRHCMYLVCSRLQLSPPNPTTDETLLRKLGDVTIVDRDVELNVALNAFVVSSSDERSMLERHPIDVISFAYPAKEDALKGVLCFVSNVSVEAGRRCFVFMEPDRNIEFIYMTMRKIFKLKNQGSKKPPVNEAPPVPARDPPRDADFYSLSAARGLQQQLWFHGEIERAQAEAKLREDGDFLVRMSRNTANNCVLSGVANSVRKHFLLLDENDHKVRKHGQVFETIVELIQYHRERNVPIISEGSELHLIRPIVRDATRP